MNENRIFETEQFQKDLARLEKAGQARVGIKLRQTVYPVLRQQPHLGPQIKKLRGYSPPTWRCRIGSWRFFFEIDDIDHVVSMLAISHRSSAY